MKFVAMWLCVSKREPPNKCDVPLVPPVKTNPPKKVPPERKRHAHVRLPSKSHPRKAALIFHPGKTGAFGRFFIHEIKSQIKRGPVFVGVLARPRPVCLNFCMSNSIFLVCVLHPPPPEPPTKQRAQDLPPFACTF